MRYISMHISPINNYKNNYTSFKSVNRYVRLNDGRFYQTFTQFFRTDVKWSDFVNFLENKYKNTSKVNIFNLACSEGAETCSVAIALAENLKENSKKFQIFASDIDLKNIEIAQNGIWDITNRELYRLNKITNNKFDKYFMPETCSTGEISKLKIKPELKDKIEFKVSDILTEIKNAPKKDSIFMIRNVWPYLNFEERTEILRELAKLDKSCCVVIGEIDSALDVGQALEFYGFKKTPIINVYEKEF